MSIQRARELIAEAIKTLQEADVELAVWVGEPPVVKTAVFLVTDEKTLAHHVAGWNKATPPRPIMEIWPSPTSKPDQRMKWLHGEVIHVFSEPIKADGAGNIFYEIRQTKEDEKLYVNASDGVIKVS